LCKQNADEKIHEQSAIMTVKLRPNYNELVTKHYYQTLDCFNTFDQCLFTCFKGKTLQVGRTLAQNTF
jgi:hypothetical protein